MKTFKLIINSFKNTEIMLVLYFIFSLIISYLTTFIPVVFQYFLDILLKQKVSNRIIEKFIKIFSDDISFIIKICVLLIILEIVIVLSTYLRTIVKNKIVQEFQYEIKFNLFNHIQNLTYHDFYKNSLADLVQSSTDDVNNIVGFIEKQLSFILDLVLIIIFAIGQLYTLNLCLSIIMVVAITIIIISSIFYYKKSKTTIENSLRTQRELYAKLNDNYSNVKFMKVNNLSKKEINNFNELNNNNFKANKEKIKLDSFYKTFTSSVVKTQTPVILLVSSILYSEELITIGSIYVTINYSNKITRSFTDLSEILEVFNLFITSYKRINKLLYLSVEDDNKSKKLNNLTINDTTITFKNTSIKVNGTIILKDLNFTIAPNEKVMIIGGTGSGKSILFKTLIGFYEYEGSIKIGDYEIKDLNKKYIRENICLLLQDSYLFSRTIAENIRILIPNMSDTEMINLSTFFSFHKDVQKLYDGYNSKIGKNGIVLSKGQKQRLVLIRAYTKPKPIMIFDDSFSAIDRINKKEILDKLLQLNDGSSKIFITHDIHLASKFDKVIYLYNGYAISGTHEELLNNKQYKAIYELDLNKVGEEYV